MVPAETTQQIREVFETTCIEFFRSLNCSVDKLESSPEAVHNAPLSYIDAGSGDMEVVIVLRAPLPALSITYPGFQVNNILSISDEKLEDWITEMANQLMGRFKNQMLALGCTLQIGLPELNYDPSSVRLPVADHEGYRLSFDLDKQCIECSLYLRVLNEGLLLTRQQHADSGAASGELELF